MHACKIDNEMPVGMGTIVLDVKFAVRSIIGANALVKYIQPRECARAAQSSLRFIQHANDGIMRTAESLA
jgi:carbonic anhydrase/acetyltransferase-like protein (isoleucine patch superfamily)